MSEQRGGEQCQACLQWGEDRRTLRMACFYEMGELRMRDGRPLPFDEQVVLRAPPEAELRTAAPPTTIRTSRGTVISLGAGTVTTDAELTPQALFTLRVCKACRARWMHAIAEWFSLTREVAEAWEDQAGGRGGA